MVKVLKLDAAGELAEEATAAAGGGPNANKIPHLDGSGRLAEDMMPVGIGADTQTLTASEALSEGEYVNVWDDGGTWKVRLADASNGRKADGFVLANVAQDGAAVVYVEGENASAVVQGGGNLSPGAVFLSATTPGAVTQTRPTTAGHIVQQLGGAWGVSTVNTELGQKVTLA